MNDLLNNKITTIPQKPGVYQFINDKGEIIYIGKAKNLRTRVRSYFQKNKYQTPKNQSMIKRILDLEWIVVSSEVEALLTEANLIKENKPHYNINLKDDKSFPYIRITKEAYPRIFITREIVKDGSRYFGPYTDVYVLRRSLKAVHKIFPIRSCDFLLDKKTIQSLKVDLCLDYHIKKCDGPCQNLISEDEYNKMIKRVISFLQGRTTETEVYINDQMLKAANDTRYEDAGMYRDQLNAIKNFKDRQRKVAADFDDRDVIALSRKDNMCISVVVRIRNGRIHSREKISMNISDETDSDIIELVITQFYLNSDFIPKVLNVSDIPTNKTQLIHWLKEKRNGNIEIKLPIKGDKAREIRLAEQNAKLLLGEWIINRTKRRELIPKMIQQLQEDLQLNIPPRRIEAFDISHLGGEDTVASMVSFIDGKAKKSEYRKYKIKGVNGIDDFAAIREVVVRRYRKLKDEKSSYPDLILIDGGKGQLNMAISALRDLGLDYLLVIGLAKRLEEVFVPGNSDPQSIPKNSPGLILLRKIRDEAHRFALTYQKQKRNKKVRESIFDSVNGMGPKRIQSLLRSFEGIENIANADSNIIADKANIPLKIAKDIFLVAKQFQMEQKSK
ncbi:MAG: excinuclease ABC subunit UvrC [Candidatus Neomarinimicrobiota bacterium]|nr:excinuclease ABC subunit C [Candidatus Neomarinimicrobiota bacterium]MEC9273283.1 excinuclease ABC subunit UvrC [Candidatus Neomarinimicrobiota bacterium]